MVMGDELMHNRQGFTLMELLSVVVILGVLTAVALPQYTKAVHRTEAANALANLKTVFDSAKRYYSSFDTWPTSFRGLDTKLLLNAGSTDTSGAYQYSFPTDEVLACKMVGTSSLYCLRAHRDTFGSATPDIYTCESSRTKYQNMCASLCNTTTMSSACTIQ